MKNSQIYSTDKKPAIVCLVMTLLLIAAVLVAICIGSVSISPDAVWNVISGKERGTTQANIILLVRIPRVFGCLVAGAALAVSGTVIQTVLANPLAAPNVIGVNAGAGFAVALFSALMPAYAAFSPLAAFTGALLAVLLVLTIAEKSGASKITLVLAGVAVSSVFGALIDATITFFPEALNGYSDFRIGGLANLSMARVVPAFWTVAVAIAVLLSLHNEMDVLSLGMETASTLGLNAKPLRILLLALAAALAGAAVSFAGLLGFVGLIVPHVVRMMVGESSRELISASALGGALLLTVCDLAARALFAPYELSVGILLSCIGGPFFIHLLIKQRGGRSHD